MSKKVCILTSRPIGKKCFEWATLNTPKGFEIVETLEESDIVISVLYDKILKSSQLKSRLCFNFHPGCLPEYRGSGSNSWVLINEEEKTGVTLHLIDEGIDTGDIIEIREFMISKKDTAETLNKRTVELIFKMFKDWFKDLLNDNYTSVPQNKNRGRTYFRKDLQRQKNLTKFVKAFCFEGKDPAFFVNEAGKKIILYYKEGNKK